MEVEVLRCFRDRRDASMILEGIGTSALVHPEMLGGGGSGDGDRCKSGEARQCCPRASGRSDEVRGLPDFRGAMCGPLPFSKAGEGEVGVQVEVEVRCFRKRENQQQRVRGRRRKAAMLAQVPHVYPEEMGWLPRVASLNRTWYDPFRSV